MTEPRTTTRIPAPFYAAAGAGELAYQQLRKLPAVFTELTGKASSTTTDLRDRANATLRTANTTAVGLREKAVTTTEFDVDRLREAAVRNAAVVVAGAQSAQERAFALYGALVARGERIVGSGVVQAAGTVNADIEATEAPAAVTPSPAAVAETVEAKPVAKRPRAARAAKTTAPASTPSAKLPAKSTAKRTRSAAK
jgi:heparin binding hemagglutinin HbhA